MFAFVHRYDGTRLPGGGGGCVAADGGNGAVVVADGARSVLRRSDWLSHVHFSTFDVEGEDSDVVTVEISNEILITNSFCCFYGALLHLLSLYVCIGTCLSELCLCVRPSLSAIFFPFSSSLFFLVFHLTFFSFFFFSFCFSLNSLGLTFEKNLKIPANFVVFCSSQAVIL